MKLVCNLKSKKHIVGACLSGLIYSFIFVVGYYVEKKGGLLIDTFSFWLEFLAGILIFSLISYVVMNLELQTSGSHDIPDKDSRAIKRFSIIIFASLFIIYAIWLLGVYPGYFAYDAPTQWEMFQKHEITGHHPVIHTLIIGWCLRLGEILFDNLNKGAFIYSFGQMVFSVFAFTTAMVFMYKRNAKRIFLIFSYLWFALYPTVVINVFATTKDSIFAPLNLIFMLLTIKMLTEEEDFWQKKIFPILWCLVSFLCSIFRNNAVYTIVILLCILLIRAIVKKKNILKRYLPIVLSWVILFALYKGPFCNSVTISGLNEKEFFSIPIQQVLWVYMNNNDEMTTEEKAVVEDMFTENTFKYYHSKVADWGKSEFDPVKFNDNKKFYTDYWLNLGRKHPMEYINAFLGANIGLWYPETTLMIDLTGREAYCICHSYDFIVDDSFFPFIFNYLHQFEDSDWVVKNDTTKWIFAPATIFCIFLAITLISFSRKRPEAILLGYMLLFWLTYLLGPVALVRYVSYLFYSIPVLFWMLGQMLKEEHQ